MVDITHGELGTTRVGTSPKNHFFGLPPVPSFHARLPTHFEPHPLTTRHTTGHRLEPQARGTWFAGSEPGKAGGWLVASHVAAGTGPRAVGLFVVSLTRALQS